MINGFRVNRNLLELLSLLWGIIRNNEFTERNVLMLSGLRSFASALLHRVTGCITDSSYNQKQISEIEAAGQTAAFDMIEAALNKKISKLGLHCPIKRIVDGTSAITLSAGNLNNGIEWYGDAQIVLSELSARTGFLESGLERLYKPDQVRPDVMYFDVRCPKNALYENPPQKFMEFFKALGFGPLRTNYDMQQADAAIKSGDTNWVAYTDLCFFQAVSGRIEGVTHGRIISPTVGFLQAIDINPVDFANAVTNARTEKAKQFGPVRETHTKVLAYNIGCG